MRPMTLPAGTHELGPGDDATLQVKTYREGIAAKAGHDLVIEVTSWRATIDVAEDRTPSKLELSADPASLEVRDGLRGVKPLTDKDRVEIRKNIDEKVLGREPISFRSTELELDEQGSLSGSGELRMAGSARPVGIDLTVGSDGRITGTVALTQSEWGIKPYRGLMGALKVRDSLDVVIDARLPSG